MSVKAKIPTASDEPATPSRYYSPEDKNLVSDSLRELRETLAKEVRPLKARVQAVQERWVREAQRNREIEPGAVAETRTELTTLRNETVALAAKIFKDWVTAHPGFEELFNGIVGQESQTPLTTLSRSIDLISPALRAIEASQQSEFNGSSLSITVDRLMIPMGEATNQVNNWINETSQRIEQAEKEILGG